MRQLGYLPLSAINSVSDSLSAAECNQQWVRLVNCRLVQSVVTQIG